ncbi:MAG: metal-sensitive transcriptional regulator [Candidatus Thermoplasmatota archaeon]|jgi:DNA-binding FrmR family transcriptional regulator
MDDHGPAPDLDSARAEMRARLARAHGHLHGVLDMIDAGRGDDAILHQLNAVRAALSKATSLFLDDLIKRAQEAPVSRRKLALGQLRAAVQTLA